MGEEEAKAAAATRLRMKKLHRSETFVYADSDGQPQTAPSPLLEQLKREKRERDSQANRLREQSVDSDTTLVDSGSEDAQGDEGDEDTASDNDDTVVDEDEGMASSGACFVCIYSS